MADTDVGESFDRDAAAARYLPRVTAYARKLAGRSPQLFEDAEGEAVIALAKAVNNYRGGDFQTYVMKVVRNRVRRKLAQLRAQAAARPGVFSLNEDTDQARPEPATRALSADTVERLRRHPDQLRAVELVCCQSMSHAQAARVMGCSKAQVGALLKKAAEELGPPGWDRV